MSNEGLEAVLTELGIGPWNCLFFITAGFVSGTIPVFLIGSDFINPEPRFVCNVPNSTYYASYNGSECVMVVKDDQQQQKTVPCTSWTYDTSVYHTTVAMEWDLVCERAFLASLFQTIYTVGSIVGCIPYPAAAHRYGVRWAVRAGTLGTAISLVVLLTTPWFYLLLVSRFFLGFYNAFMTSPVFMLAMEVCVLRLRPKVGVMLALPYALMMIVLAALAYVIRDWRTLQLAASFPFLLLIPFICVVDESPRWLLVHGYVDKAVAVLQRGARLNRVQLSDPTTLAAIISLTPKTSQSRASGPSEDARRIQISTIDGERVSLNSRSGGLPAGLTYGTEGGQGGTSGCTQAHDTKLGAEDGVGSWWAGPVALVRSCGIRKMMGVLTTIWFLQGVVYLGLPLNSNAFTSPFTYMALLGVMEVPAYSLTIPITMYLGRRVVVSFCLIASGSLLLLLWIFKLTIVSGEWVDLSLVLMSYLLVCTAYQVNSLFVAELLPTTLRPWGSAACFMAVNLGCCVPPLITEFLVNSLFVAELLPTTLRPWGSAACFMAVNLGCCVPPLITEFLAEDQPLMHLMLFGLCGVLSGSLVTFLPETNGRPLLETVADFRARMSTKTPTRYPAQIIE